MGDVIAYGLFWKQNWPIIKRLILATWIGNNVPTNRQLMSIDTTNGNGYS